MTELQVLQWYRANKRKQSYYGTFADNLRAPIHRWFKYPAGYSYKLVAQKIKEYSLNEHSWILDPFAGCGTTPVEAKKHGINSVGIERHPFVYWVARTKTFWELDLNKLHRVITDTMEDLAKQFDEFRWSSAELETFPTLLGKCYSKENLAKLKLIRDHIRSAIDDDRVRDFVNLALTDTLRAASKAGAGWPYIAPTKYHEKQERDAFEVFSDRVYAMFKDLRDVLAVKSGKSVKCTLIKGDARKSHAEIAQSSIDLIVTSPPYLNNYDYADRTRLELYFFGQASTWRDITVGIRNKLMMAATTQVDRSQFDLEKPLSCCIRDASPKVYEELTQKIVELSKVRRTKGGKKSYDCMVAGYFNDMHKVLQRLYEYLKRGKDCIIVLGDSAPYGIHIPTDEYIARLSLGIGCSKYKIQTLRVRGKKWANNPQRHNVLLRESIVQITK